MNLRKLPRESADWLADKALAEGFVTSNRIPSVWRLLQALTNGEYELTRTAKHRDNLTD